MYEQVKDQGWDKRWGNQEPKFWQFSANGRVAGLEIDVNAFSGTRAELYALAEAEPPGARPERVDTPSEQRHFLGVDPADGSLYERDPESVRRAIVRNPDQTPVANTKFVTDEHGLLHIVRLDRRHPEVEVPELPADAIPIVRSDSSISQGGNRPLAGLRAGQRKRIAHPGSGWYANTYPTHHDWNDDVYRFVLKYEAQYAGIYLNTYFMHPPVFGRTWEFRSFDVWHVAGRGFALNSGLGDEVHRTIMGDPEPPWIAWIIYKGVMWTPERGREPWDLQPDDGSDFGHWRHIHVTFAFPSTWLVVSPVTRLVGKPRAGTRYYTGRFRFRDGLARVGVGADLKRDPGLISAREQQEATEGGHAPPERRHLGPGSQRAWPFFLPRLWVQRPTGLQISAYAANRA